jgi:thiamine transport system permease protein
VGIGGLFTGSIGSVALFTFAQATLSTVLTLVVGLPGAAVLARFRFWGRGLIEALSVVAFVMPTVVVAAAVGEVVPDRGLAAILLAHVYFNLAVVLRIVGAYWSQLNRRPGEAAAALGAAPWRVFWSVTLPQLRPVLLSASAIVFLFTFTSFGIILLLGGPGMATIEVEIQRQALFLFNLPLAAALSLLQMVIVGALLLAQVRLTRSVPATDESTAGSLRPPCTPVQRAAVACFVVTSVVVLSGPLLMIVLRALRFGDGWGWGNFTGLQTSRADSILFVSPAEALANSLLYALAAAIIATVVGGVIAWLVVSGSARARGWDALLLLPLGVSAVALGFGILIAFDADPVNWRATFWMVPVAQALIAIPFVVRALVPALEAIGPRVRQAAATLGAGPLRVWWHVEVPMVWRSLLVALGFSFAISLGEFGATLFVARGDHPTVPIAIYRLLGTPGETNQGQAMALAAILIVVTATIVLLTERWRWPGSSHV